MPFEKISDKMRDLDGLINQSSTGPPCELADTLKISPGMVLSLIEKLRKQGSVIEFCSKRRTFYYKLRKPYTRDDLGRSVHPKPQRDNLMYGVYPRAYKEHNTYWSEGQI